jgi:pimeloyl-ACP methyl ester carboxylesterase
VWSHLLHALARDHCLVRYDERGNGLSECVVETTGVQRFALLGISQGCVVWIAYAARHPERVSHLVLYGGYARGRLNRGSAAEVKQAAALMTLIRQGWGRETPAFRQMFTSLFIPGGTIEQMQWFNDLQRITASPQNAMRIRKAMNRIDVTDLLPKITTPTLVIHCRNDAVVPFEEGCVLAAGIRGSRFVVLEGSNHIILESEPTWGRFLEEVIAFLKT